MAIINKTTKYIERKTVGNKNYPRRYNLHDYRDWWFGQKLIYIGSVSIPKELHGKKLRFKLEIMDD